MLYTIGKIGNKIISASLILCMVMVMYVPVFATDDMPATQDAASPESTALGLYGKKAEKTKQIEIPPEREPSSKTVAEALTRKYEAREGSFELTNKTRFYIATDKLPTEEILSTVRLMDAEFASEKIPSEKVLSVVHGAERFAKKGDIVIVVEGNDKFNPEIDTADINQTYMMSIEKENIVITATGKTGIYYGLISLLQMAKEKNGDEDKSVLDCCYIEDGPDSIDRHIFLDCGRKYFSKEWIENFIKRSSFQRYNKIILHFSESECLRIDSEVFPWITEGVDSISRQDMVEIAKVARTYNMEVIPSFDVPGHNRYLIEKYESYVKKNPDFTFTYNDKTYDKNTKGFGSIANHYSYNGKTKKTNGIGIDVTDEYDVAFMDALIDDYAKFFRKLGSNEFDICGDEILGWNEFELDGKTFDYYNRWEAIQHWDKFAVNELGIKNGSARDTFINYLNTVSNRLESFGYKCRVFNDDIGLNKNQHIKLRKSVEIVYWSGGNTPAKSYADKGHTMYNDISKWCYYVVADWGDGDYMKNKYKTVNSKNIFENWNPRSFSSKPGAKKTVDPNKFGGAYFSIWCDRPDYKNEKKIWKETELRTWANATKMWNPKVNTTESGIGAGIKYEDFKTFAESMKSFPGFQGNPAEEVEMPVPAKLHSGMNLFQKLISFL
ncbi:MAG: family 20 glycosylhydrolase [Clostridiales bacterium]|nr:family 20 glycosylhydrolase [Clostridiales bacterium]